MKDRSRLLHFVIHLIHPIPNFLVLSFHLNTFYFFFLPSNPSSPRCTLQNPSKSLKILRCHATVLVHLSILAIIPLTGSPQGGCVRSLEAQTASRLAARDRVDKKQPGLEKGVRGRREYYADPPRWG